MDEKAKTLPRRDNETRKIADSSSDETTRESPLSDIASYEQMAVALDTVAPADRARPKHPVV
jgi:hypothetical protein